MEKVDCYPEEIASRSWQRSWAPDRRGPIQLKRIAPFCMSPVGTRMHRCRTGFLYPPFQHSKSTAMRLVPHPWCGCCLSRAIVTDDPGQFEVCGTCEGRAIGAGQIVVPGLEPMGLVFSPRAPVMRCGWEAMSYGAYGSSSYPCRRRGQSTAVRGDEVIYVCRTHEYSAFRHGFAINEGVPLDPDRS